MVMEAPPTPQCVGREFVRQYYTLLNKAPTHLHRFYNNQSSFVHGGLDASNRDTNPVIGQKQIHQKIQQLNFRDCHAKITQVDSQATLGNGVVVQVTGELSNAGQPMRRFTQTFVLAAQSPKKYYVHNDIFRYQDEIFTDEECDPESSRSEADDEMSQEHPSLQDSVQQQPTLTQQPIPYYSPNTAAAALQGANMPPVAAPHHHGAPQQQQHPILAPQQQQQVPTVNGSVHPEDLPNVIAAATGPVVPQAHIPATQTQGMSPHAAALGSLQGAGLSGAAVPSHGASPLVQQLDEEQQSMEEPQGVGDVPIDDGYGAVIENQDLEVEPTDVQEIETAVVSNEPKTYANLLKSGGNAGTANTGYMNSVQVNVQVAPSPTQVSKPLSSSPPPQQNRYEQRESSMGGPMSNNTPLNQRNSNGPRGIRNNTQRGVTRQDSRGLPRNNFNDDDDRRRTGGGASSQYGDSHQLFLGNLPHHATEEELRDIFGQFGTIMDLRIHSKGPTKGGPPGGRIPPNYGFITYDDPTGVQNCLLAKPLYFPNNSESGQKLNVEEKKTRPRPSMDGGRPDNGGGRPGGNSGPRTGGNMGGGGVGRGTGTGMGRGGRGGGSFSRGGPPNRTGGTGQNTTNTYNNRR